MARLHFVKAARKAIPSHGIEVGDSYYWWKNRLPGRAAGVKRVSKERPRPSQMVGSAFRRSVMEITENMGSRSFEDAADLEAAKGDWMGQIEDLADEQEDKLGNMPDSLQDSPTGELLQDRRDALRDWANELDGVTIPDRGDYEAGEDGDQEFVDALQDAVDEMIALDPGL